MANYMSGPALTFNAKAVRTSTFEQIERACKAANARLGSEHRLEPEAIVEGGFVFVDWPGKQPGQYKTVRFSFERWPFVSDGTAAEGPTGTTMVLGPRDRDRISTHLKAFHGAPAFTRNEVTAVANALAACFAGCRVVRVPSDKALRSDYLCHAGSEMAAPPGAAKRQAPHREHEGAKRARAC
jgi:hypothetical protein